LKHLAAWADVLKGVLEFFVVLVVAIYFIADAKGCINGFGFPPEIHRQKTAGGRRRNRDGRGHYMIGQVITSALCAAYAFGVLFVLHVPSAALLAVLAGVFDVLPLIGFFLFAIPAVAMALTVSPTTAAPWSQRHLCSRIPWAT